MKHKRQQTENATHKPEMCWSTSCAQHSSHTAGPCIHTAVLELSLIQATPASLISIAISIATSIAISIATSTAISIATSTATSITTTVQQQHRH